MKKTAEQEYNEIATSYNASWKNYLQSTHKVALSLLRPKSSEVILDASGGTGLFTEIIAQNVGATGKVNLIDISSEMLNQARKSLQNYPNVHLQQANVEDIPFPNETFDKISCVNAFHYYTNPIKVMEEFFRVLKKSGRIVIVDWHRDTLHFKIFNYLMKKSPKHAHYHIYKTQELKTLLINNRFQIQKKVKWHYAFWSLLGMRAVKQK
jgi:ubiquinone/menaquinone biosynthesis C-methylase UbiE